MSDIFGNTGPYRTILFHFDLVLKLFLYAFEQELICAYRVSNGHRSHDLRKFPQIYAVSVGVALVIMRILCILGYYAMSHYQLPSSL